MGKSGISPQKSQSETSEGHNPVAARCGIRPSQEEVDAHRVAGHCPFRNWCEECVMGQAQEDPHRKDSKEKREGVSLVVMVYEV